MRLVNNALHVLKQFITLAFGTKCIMELVKGKRLAPETHNLVQAKVSTKLGMYEFEGKWL